MTVKLRDHQEEAVGRMHNGCVLRGGVGSGKTITSLAYYMRHESKTDIYVITTAKKRDSLEWQGDAAKFGIGTTADATVAGVLRIDSWNNIGKYESVEGAFFIFDEQRIVGKGAWVKSFLRIARRNRWILLSATPGDTWADYIPLFVANGFYKNRTEFLRNHAIFNTYGGFPKIERFVDTGILSRYRNKVTVEMHYQPHAERVVNRVMVEYDVERYTEVTKKRWHIYEDRPIKDVSELFALMRRLVNTDPSRIKELEKIWRKHPKLIVFYNFDYELEILREWSSTLGVETAEWNGHRHQALPSGESWLYLVQYTAGSEGWNCTATDTIAFYSLTYSYRAWEQSQGRIDRLNTPFKVLNYFFLASNSSLDKAILGALRAKKSFNERKFENSWPKTQI